MLILNSFRVGSWRIDSAPVSALEHLERALEAELGVGRGRDREPEVELVGAQVVVRDAGVRVDDLRRAVRVLGVDLRRDQHRVVAERAGVEDRRDLADDPLVDQALRAGHQLVELEVGLGGERRERLGDQREVRLQQVHQPLVGLVERDRRAVLARADLRLRRLRYAASHRRDLLRVVGEDHVGAGAADRGQRLERRRRARRSSRWPRPPSASSTRRRPGRRRPAGRSARARRGSRRGTGSAGLTITMSAPSSTSSRTSRSASRALAGSIW